MADASRFFGQSSSLVKENLAATLREAIIDGRLAPGESIVEGKWATKLSVAQASVREALNILANEGFVQKESGRSATVTVLSEGDLAHIYQARGPLESLAARLVVEKRADLTDIEQIVADMRAAADRRNVEAYYRRDLNFHLAVCHKTGNPFLEQAVRRMVGPLFAFAVMRTNARAREIEELQESVEQHQALLDALRTGDPDFAERQFKNALVRFFQDTSTILAQSEVSAAKKA